ncbi:putative cysteine-rich receptor-like protein kinase 16 isoform X2 [Neltuma alba]|uniref:putative cysteine-rich receptor-like protein kinase 16 isoform X2 n=1 Tax=Neltuma alba TaxID=207710 RepID=UPI0010A2C524|nr:putative cysteine-rich receptor-like protein kinase 16 isoform X2 [Prosopis alba]
MQICLPNSDGKAFAGGCFMRYSTTSFFPDNYQTIDITPLEKQGGGSRKKKAITGGVVGGGSFLLILLALFALYRRSTSSKRIHRGDIDGLSKLKGLINFSYRELKFATKGFSAKNKIGEGGFGAVYKQGTLENGKIVAVKKLNLHQSKKVEEEFESEVKLISNIHHRNLIQLLGYCSEGNERILIYEYMKNTSLDKFLFEDTLHQNM